MLGWPEFSTEIEPIIGDESTINLNSIPKVKDIIRDVVNDEVADLCYPNKFPLNIPITVADLKLDKDGNIIFQ